MPKKIIDVLVTELTADGAKLKLELDDSLRHTKAWGDKMTSIAKGIGTGLAVGGTALASSAAVLTKAAIDNADALFEQSQKLGISTETLSAYQYAASMSGLTTEKFNGYLNKFNRTLVDAYKGNGKGAESFELLGVQVKDAEGNMRSSTDVLIDLADAFSRLPDSAGKAALAQDIFGKSGAEMLPFLNNGAVGIRDLANEAERFNLVVDSKTAEAANKFNDELDKIAKGADGVGNKLAAEALPSLVKLAEFVTDPDTQKGLGIVAEGVLEITAASYKFIGTITGLSLAADFLGELISTADKLKPSELAQKQKELNELIGRARIAYGDEFWKDQAFHRDTASKDIQRLKAEIKSLREKPQKDLEADLNAFGYEKAFETYKDPKTAEDLIGSSDYEDKKKELLKNWAVEQQREIAMMMERENKAREAADREVLMQREKFAAIHEEMLQADNKVVDLESYRYQRRQEDLEKELGLLREKGLLTAELEAEFQKAREEQEISHQAKLKAIKEKAAEEDLKRRIVQLEGAESLFDSLGDLTEEFGGKSSRLRKALLIAEKASAISRATIAIQTGIAEAAANPWPINLGAMASVVGATAGIVSNIQSVNIAHGGMTNIPKESTYLLDAGERVVSPKQNRDLTAFLQNAGGSGSFRIEVINNATNVPMSAQASMINDETLRIVLHAVDAKLSDDLGNGRGVWRQAQARYGLAVKGGY